MLRAIRFYQRAISARMPPSCLYQPTCSQYAYEAIGRHGPWRGAWLAARRLGRCHPGRAGGYDPAPPPRGDREATAAPAHGAAGRARMAQPEESKAH